MGTKDTQTAIYCVFDDGKKVHNADTTGAQRGHKGYTTGHKGHNRAQRVHNRAQRVHVNPLAVKKESERWKSLE